MGQLMELRQEILIIAEVFVPVVDADDCSCRGLDCSSSCSWDLHDADEAKLDGAVLKQVHQLVRFLYGHRNYIPSPFGIGDNVLLVFAFLRAQIHWLGVVWIDFIGILIFVERYSPGCGRFGDCGRDGAGEGGDTGIEDFWVYDGRHIRVVSAVFSVVLPTPGSCPAHPVGFIASQIKAWVW